MYLRSTKFSSVTYEKVENIVVLYLNGVYNLLNKKTLLFPSFLRILQILQIALIQKRPSPLKITPLFLNSLGFRIGRVQIKIVLFIMSGDISLYES